MMSEQWMKNDERASFWLVFVLGVATMIFGIVVLAWPDATVKVLAVFVGIWFMAMGFARIVGAFVVRRGLGRALLSGIVGILLSSAAWPARETWPRASSSWRSWLPSRGSSVEWLSSSSRCRAPAPRADG
jgi:Short repeat of unknown function (DUF308)